MSSKNQPQIVRRARRPALERCCDRPHPERPWPRPDRPPHHPRLARTGRSPVPARQPGHPHRTLRQRPRRQSTLRGRRPRRHQPDRRPRRPSTPGQPDPRPLEHRVPALAPRHPLPGRQLHRPHPRRSPSHGRTPYSLAIGAIRIIGRTDITETTLWPAASCTGPSRSSGSLNDLEPAPWHSRPRWQSAGTAMPWIAARPKPASAVLRTKDSTRAA